MKKNILRLKACTFNGFLNQFCIFSKTFTKYEIVLSLSLKSLFRTVLFNVLRVKMHITQFTYSGQLRSHQTLFKEGLH